MRIPKAVLGAVSVLLVLGLVALPVAQILFREVLRLPVFGLDEVARMFMILGVFLAYPLVVEAGENIVMGEFKAGLPRPALRIADALIGLCCIAACAMMVWALWETLAANPRNRTPTLGIPFWIYLASAAIGFAGAALLHVARLFRPVAAPVNVTAS
jgi:TRAP-type C4-dicarboxylate transport system permease small subunit